MSNHTSKRWQIRVHHRGTVSADTGVTMSNHSNINDPGENGTIQQLVYRAARATTPQEWQALERLATRVLDNYPTAKLDTTEGLLINALCAALQKVNATQDRLSVSLKCLASEMVDNGAFS